MDSSIHRDAVISSPAITIQSLFACNSAVFVYETHRSLSSGGAGGLTGQSPEPVEELLAHPATKSKKAKKVQNNNASGTLHGASSRQTKQSLSLTSDQGENDRRDGGGDGTHSSIQPVAVPSSSGITIQSWTCNNITFVPATEAHRYLSSTTKGMLAAQSSAEELGVHPATKPKITTKRSSTSTTGTLHGTSSSCPTMQSSMPDEGKNGGRGRDCGDAMLAPNEEMYPDTAKLFYKREKMSSSQGLFYTYKLMLDELQNHLKDFVMLPVPPGFNVMTRIERVKKRMSSVYYMHIERGDRGPVDRERLVLVARKHRCLGGTCYILSTDPAELTRKGKSEQCEGFVKSNLGGTEWSLVRNRSNCTHIPPEKGALAAVSKQEGFQDELALIFYKYGLAAGPRKIKVVVPKMKNLLEREEIRPQISKESLGYKYRNHDKGSILTLKNKDPTWNSETDSYSLNFSGRVSVSSVKNFQIVSGFNETHVMLQFGRQSKNTFSLDFRYPFCPLQAFAIALSSFEDKLPFPFDCR